MTQHPDPITIVPVLAAVILLSVMLGGLAAVRFARWLAARRAHRVTFLHARILRRRK